MLSHFIGGIMLVTDSPPGVLEPLLRRTLVEADPNLTITSVRTMQQQIDLLCDRDRAVASLSGLFGFVALLLASVGVYGVTAYMVARQTNEFGIRMALGCESGQGDPAGSEPSFSSRCRGARGGPASRCGCRKAHGVTAVWRVVLGSLRPVGCSRIACGLHILRRRHPGGSCCHDLAHERATH